jgi:Cu-Zn family superoxide dismutase
MIGAGVNRSAGSVRQGVQHTVVSLGEPHMNRRTVTTTAATAGLVTVAALGVAAPALADVIRAGGEVTRYPDQAPLADAPAGATARVQAVETGNGRTIVTLHVSGFEGLEQYGAHAHTNACGQTGAAAGPHFQYQPGGATDPAYANPENEIWLDFATNPAGEGRAKAVVDWQFPSERRAKSVIIHEGGTSTGAGVAGTAGKRVACISVPF